MLVNQFTLILHAILVTETTTSTIVINNHESVNLSYERSSSQLYETASYSLSMSPIRDFLILERIDSILALSKACS